MHIYEERDAMERTLNLERAERNQMIRALLLELEDYRDLCAKLEAEVARLATQVTIKF